MLFSPFSSLQCCGVFYMDSGDTLTPPTGYSVIVKPLLLLILEETLPLQ